MTETTPPLLVVDDKPNMLTLLVKILRPLGRVETAETVAAAVLKLEGDTPAVVLCDLRLADGDGLDVLRALKARAPEIPFILMTAYATIPTAVRAMREGAFDYITKPFDPDEVRTLVSRALAGPAPVVVSGPPAFEGLRPPPASVGEDNFIDLSLKEALGASRNMTSKRYVVGVLHRHGGDVVAAAAHAGIERESFYRLMRKYGLSASEFRKPGGADGS